MRQLHNDDIRPDIDRQVLAQIESRFDRESAMELHVLGTACPRVLQFVFNFDLPRQDDELGRRSGLFEINSVVNGHARLQVRDVDEGVAQILAESLQVRRALMSSSPRPSFESPEREASEDGRNEDDKGESRWPGNSAGGTEPGRSRLSFESRRFGRHPKKVPPPTPDGREGRLFPPEQSGKLGC